MRARKLIYRVHEAMDTLGVSRSTIYRLVAAGDLQLIKIGSTKSSGITAESLEAMLSIQQASEDTPKIISS